MDRGSYVDDGTVSVSFVERDFQQSFDPQACAAAPTARAILSITGGTGANIGATGKLEATREGRIIGARAENCVPPQKRSAQGRGDASGDAAAASGAAVRGHRP